MSVYFKKFVGSFNMKRNSGEVKTTNNDRTQITNEDSLILSLPKEMLVEIFVNIPVGNLLGVMLTCKGFYEATNESILWQRKFVRNYIIFLLRNRLVFRIRVRYYAVARRSTQSRTRTVISLTYRMTGNLFSKLKQRCAGIH